MIYARAIHRVDPNREDVYLASVGDQEAVMGESADFRGRTVLRSQLEPGLFWVLDAWIDENAMQYALAAARTLASVAALLDEPEQRIFIGKDLAVADPPAGSDPTEGTPPFFLDAENWVKGVCMDQYLDLLSRRAEELRREPGFRSRLMLTDSADQLHRHVLDEWESEQAAYESYQRRETSQIEATRFLSLLAERGPTLLATGIVARKRREAPLR